MFPNGESKLVCDSSSLAWAMLWGGSAVLIWAISWRVPWKNPSQPEYWAILGYLAIFGSALAYRMFFALIRRVGVQRASFTEVASPLIAIIFSVVLENFRSSPIGWCGMAIVFSSVALIFVPERFAKSVREFAEEAMVFPRKR